MKIFISWSGKKSKYVADSLHEWLPNVIQSIKPWMSSKDIEAGERWNKNIAEELSEINFGIICVTKNNITSPWLLFETGALAKSIDNSYVCPYLINLEPSEIPKGPLAQFQAKTATFMGTQELLKTINSVIDKNSKLKENQLKETFKKWWSDLETKINKLPSEDENSKSIRKPEEMIPEILDIVRNIQRKQSKDFSINNMEQIDIADENFNNYLIEFLSDYIKKQNYFTPYELKIKDVIERLKEEKNNDETDNKSDD